MLKRARIAATVWGLLTLSTPAWAQLFPLLPQTNDVSFCCTQINTDGKGRTVGRNCVGSTLTPQAVNSCQNVEFSCGSGSYVQCQPSATTKGQKDCSCSTFFND
jgi:hypothetical protein